MTHGDAGAAGWLLPALVALPAALYLLGVTRWQHRRTRAWSRWRTGSWLLGLLLVAAALAPPLAAAGHADPRAHMVQHLLLGMYAPLALVLAAPVTLLLGGATPGGNLRRRVTRLLRSRPVHVLGHPLAAAALVTGGLWLLYTTPLYAATLQHPAVHHGVHAHFLASGALFAWAVAGPDPAPRRPGTAVRAAGLLLAAAGHAVLAKLLYARAGAWPPGSGQAPRDLQEAAQLMYYGGDGAELVLALALFAGWYRRAGRRLPAAGSPWRVSSPPRAAGRVRWTSAGAATPRHRRWAPAPGRGQSGSPR
ncbi:cytochrome c oxidase assembly protein [Ornithinicoccus halotolerans]|uniref:cytochrome c oxidase assembly protein n=1 Tax=Ornithinicoccus halotolerans TaxID=1748220 RepID=UPI0012967206|nr:cytochrome c oxidase assembly protein [Ornithinicoccus halotolerans]